MVTACMFSSWQPDHSVNMSNLMSHIVCIDTELSKIEQVR